MRDSGNREIQTLASLLGTIVSTRDTFLPIRDSERSGKIERVRQRSLDRFGHWKKALSVPRLVKYVLSFALSASLHSPFDLFMVRENREQMQCQSVSTILLFSLSLSIRKGETSFHHSTPFSRSLRSEKKGSKRNREPIRLTILSQRLSYTLDPLPIRDVSPHHLVSEGSESWGEQVRRRETPGWPFNGEGRADICPFSSSEEWSRYSINSRDLIDFHCRVDVWGARADCQSAASSLRVVFRWSERLWSIAGMTSSFLLSFIHVLSCFFVK